MLRAPFINNAIDPPSSARPLDDVSMPSMSGGALRPMPFGMATDLDKCDRSRHPHPQAVLMASRAGARLRELGL